MSRVGISSTSFSASVVIGASSIDDDGSLLDYDMRDAPRLHQWNVNVQREVFSSTSVTLAYVGSKGDHLQRQRDTNPVTPRVLADGTVVYGSRAGAQTISNPRVNPQFAALVSANSYAESDYHSL